MEENHNLRTDLWEKDEIITTLIENGAAKDEFIKATEQKTEVEKMSWIKKTEGGTGFEDKFLEKRQNFNK